MGEKERGIGGCRDRQTQRETEKGERGGSVTQKHRGKRHNRRKKVRFKRGSMEEGSEISLRSRGRKGRRDVVHLTANRHRKTQEDAEAGWYGIGLIAGPSRTGSQRHLLGVLSPSTDTSLEDNACSATTTMLLQAPPLSAANAFQRGKFSVDAVCTQGFVHRLDSIAHHTHTRPAAAKHASKGLLSIDGTGRCGIQCIASTHPPSAQQTTHTMHVVQIS